MKKRTILLVCLVLVVALATGLTACKGGGEPNKGDIPTVSEPPAGATVAPGGTSPSAPAAGKDLEIGLMVKSLGNSFFVEIKNGAEAAAATYSDRKVTITPFDSNNDLQQELRNAEDLATRNVDGVMLTCYDYQGSVGSVEAINNAGIPLVILDAPPANEDEVPAIVTSNNTNAGYLGAKALCEALGGEGEVLIFTTSLGYNIRLRDQGAKKAFEEYPNIELVHTEDGQLLIDVVLDKTQNFIERFPNLKGIWCAAGPAGRGAAAAVDSANADILVASVDGSMEERELIKEGKLLCSAAQFPSEIGKIGVETMVNLIDGKPPAEKFVYVDVALIDKDNVDDFD
ncbi:MAG: sugar ABC transporter substrate-binding protein [Christensenellales bacterium]|jgi:ABC-type sugar transport system substrate-binding protein